MTRVHRYNADGLAGLDRPRPGRQLRLTEAQRSEVAKWVEDGPDLKTDGVVRWRCADLRDHIATKFNVHLHERSVGKPTIGSRRICRYAQRAQSCRRSAYPAQKSDSRSSSLSILCASASVVSKSVSSWGWNSIRIAVVRIRGPRQIQRFTSLSRISSYDCPVGNGPCPCGGGKKEIKEMLAAEHTARD